jgi:hypothetical protein
MNKLKLELKYLINRLSWLGILNSPFKRFKIGFYAGKTAIGVPYFLPRKWVKYTHKDVLKAIEKHKANKNKVLVSDSQLYNMYKNYTKAVPLTIGFDSCGLGWKSKWTDTDYRFEWSPILSFVFFGYQIAITIYSPYQDHYWTSWLFYKNDTDKTKSKMERVAECREGFPQIWTSSKDGVEETIDYYDRILKTKYLKNEL